LLEEAKAIYQASYEAAKDDPSLISGLARTYLLLGKYHRDSDPKVAKEKLQEADKLILDLKKAKGPDDLANLALVQAVQSQLEEEPKEKDYMVRRADDLLEKAHQVGYNNLGRLKNDPGFRILGRDDCRKYRALVQELEKERKP
jgi:predicted metal-dependent hydrolase